MSITRHQHKLTDGNSYQFYYQVMRKTIVQFLDLFNGIKIGRYDTETGRLLSFVKVPVKFAPKSKNWYWMEKIDTNGNRIRDKILPIMGIYLVDVEIATDRKVNKFHSIPTNFHERSGDRRYMKELFANPVPYNYTFQVQILAEYMVDITQIMEQILPYFDPRLTIQVSIPELSIDGKTTEYLDLKVLYNGSNKDDSTTMGPDELRHIQWNIDFTVEGYLFKPKYDYPIIKKIYEEIVIGSQTPPPDMCSPSPTPSGANVTTTTIGLSAEKFPLDVTSQEASGALYDKDIKMLYTYEIEEDF